MNSLQFVDETGVMNGENGDPGYSIDLTKGLNLKRDPREAGLDDTDSDSDTVDPMAAGLGDPVMGPNPGQAHIPKPGKKTKGRVKIKMEFIENKLRRYTTFSKRKTGIMKKAYELSTLTGTQVMLLVASETGHVYTFATRKLQPMITSESGKALIQTCLNSPDPNPTGPGQKHAIDQRMNPTGFEETELSYAVAEDEAQKDDLSPMPLSLSTSKAYGQSMREETPSPVPMMSQPPSTQSTPTPTPTTSAYQPQQVIDPSKQNFSMQLPQGLTALIPQQASLQGSATPMNLSTMAQGGQGMQGMVASSQPQGQPMYRLSGGSNAPVLSIPAGMAAAPAMMNQKENTNPSLSAAAPSTSNQQSKVTVVSGNGQTSTAGATPMMYQTPQGVVYAQAPPNSATVSTIPEGFILNLPQTPTILGGGDAQGQQYITIPVPVSLAQQQILQPFITQQQTTATNLSQDKARK